MPVTDLQLEQDRAFRRRFLHYMVAIMVLVLVAVGLNIYLNGLWTSRLEGNQHEIRRVQDDGIVRGLKLRAIGCRTIEELGGTFGPGDPCLEAELRPYFRPGP